MGRGTKTHRLTGRGREVASFHRDRPWLQTSRPASCISYSEPGCFMHVPHVQLHWWGIQQHGSVRFSVKHIKFAVWNKYKALMLQRLALLPHSKEVLGSITSLCRVYMHVKVTLYKTKMRTKTRNGQKTLRAKIQYLTKTLKTPSSKLKLKLAKGQSH